MSALSLTTEPLANQAAFVGHEGKADLIWTREQFFDLCEIMLNGNSERDFLLVYRDKEGAPKFAKSKAPRAKFRVSWSWDTITGKAKSPVGIGFYPSNANGETRWGAMDFDAHDGNALRARGFAMAAFDILHRQPQLRVVLGTSGSDGWHLFVFSEQYHPTGEWTLLLKQVAEIVGAKVWPGICEIFPNDVPKGSLGMGIRAPGTWNPKTGNPGNILYQNIQELLRARLQREAGERGTRTSCIIQPTGKVTIIQLEEKLYGIYRGPEDCWKKDFAITDIASRQARIKGLAAILFHQAGLVVAEENVRLQFEEKTVATKASLAEHEADFRGIWATLQKQWDASLSESERDKLAKLTTLMEREVFRILKGFWLKALSENGKDFPFAVQNVGRRVKMTFQGVAKLRIRFCELRIIERTVPCIVNQKAARYRWLLS